MSQHKIGHTRHTLSHLLARAVLEHYPDAKLTLGPDTDTGFYYDIDFGDTEFSDDDLETIESTMKDILSDWDTFKQYEVTADEARKLFAGNEYKLELIDEITEAGEDITLYYSGPESEAPDKNELLTVDSQALENDAFVDLCRGGHINSPNKDIAPGSFTLDTVAGAYWRGDEDNQMLTRIYGLAFESGDELEDFLETREQAKERDHRKLGKELGLFTFSDLVGSGLPMFTPKGTVMRDALADKIEAIQSQFDYQSVTIPHITKPDLYETSGHWEKFGEELFHVEGMDSEFVMKPMNCPHHTQIYASQMRSYRDLPLRFVENTMVYRDEQSGELSGLSRVRSITQDDGHVFCRPDQMEQEIDQIVTVIEELYTALGMWGEGDNFWVSLSVSDPDSPDDYLGDTDRWDEAETSLKEIAEDRGLELETIEGEAAFYGPKIDFMFYDALDRERQLATVQLDFVMPDRFDLEYTAESGERKTPVMIHRAILGSFERFMSVAIEHFAGDFPFWMSPTQVAILPVAEEHEDFANSLADDVADIRSEVMRADDSIGKRIRRVHEKKIPLFAVVGDDEQDSGQLEFESRRDDLDDIQTTVENASSDLNQLN
jgi:threonyl-tRNA synthetase